MSEQRKAVGFAAFVTLAALAAAAASCGEHETEARSAVPQGWEVVDGTPGALGFARRARDPATGITFILVEPGRFEMGSPEGEADGHGFDEGRPRHEVEITRPFYLGETEVTVGQWRAFVKKTGYRTEAEGGDGGITLGAGGTTWEKRADAIWSRPLPLHQHEFEDAHPVTQVSWNDAQAFCDASGYRLPSEAEWEYACRAGTGTAYWWGETECGGKGKGNFADQALKRTFPGWKWATFSFDDGQVFSAPVGTYAANAWGFRDMLGNVWEWCADAYDREFYAHSPAADPLNTSGGGARSLRGGSWSDHPWFCGSANRLDCVPGSRAGFVGFRAARTP